MAADWADCSPSPTGRLDDLSEALKSNRKLPRRAILGALGVSIVPMSARACTHSEIVFVLFRAGPFDPPQPNRPWICQPCPLSEQNSSLPFARALGRRKGVPYRQDRDHAQPQLLSS
jgi:hypothetical protein